MAFDDVKNIDTEFGKKSTGHTPLPKGTSFVSERTPEQIIGSYLPEDKKDTRTLCPRTKLPIIETYSDGLTIVALPCGVEAPSASIYNKAAIEYDAIAIPNAAAVILAYAFLKTQEAEKGRSEKVIPFDKKRAPAKEHTSDMRHTVPAAAPRAACG